MDGAAVMRERGLAPGPEVGRVLRELDALIVNAKAANDRETLLRLCRMV